MSAERKPSPVDDLAGIRDIPVAVDRGVKELVGESKAWRVTVERIESECIGAGLILLLLALAFLAQRWRSSL